MDCPGFAAGWPGFQPPPTAMQSCARPFSSPAAVVRHLQRHMLPAQGENLRHAASGQHQQPYRADGNSRRPAARFRFREHRSQTIELHVRQEPFALAFWKHHQPAAWVVPLRHQVPVLRKPVHPGKGAHCPIGLGRGTAQPLMQCQHVLMPHTAHPPPPERRHDVPPYNAADSFRRRRLQAHRHVLVQIPPRHLRDGGSRTFRRRRFRRRRLTG